MASGLSDQQYVRDKDQAYRTLRLEMDAVVKVYRAESNLRRAMQIYNEGAPLAQEHFRAAIAKAREDLAARTRGEAPW